MDYKYFHLAAMALEACADNFTHPVIYSSCPCSVPYKGCSSSEATDVLYLCLLTV